MSPELASGLSGALLWFLVVATLLARPRIPRSTFDVAWCATFGALDLILAVWDFVDGNQASGFAWIALGAYNAWLLWQWWRRRRQGKPSRVLGLVRDLGHRLTVAPVPVGSRS